MTLPGVDTAPRTYRKRLVVKAIREPIVDVFDEGSALVVIAELPWGNDSDLRIEVRDSLLVLSADSGNRSYYKEIILPGHPDPRKVRSSFRSGIVEIHLSKLPSEASRKEGRPNVVR